MYYGYIRVSTDTQTTENQKIVLNEWAEKKGITIQSFISDVKSGTLQPQKRNLGTLLQQARNGDVIVCTELSRLGRSLTMIFSILQDLLDRGIGVIAVKEGYELTDSLVAKVLAFAFSISAEIERQMISERTKAGLQRARQNGKHIGRVKGQKSKVRKLSRYESEIKNKRLSGNSILQLAHEYGVQWSTMRNFLLFIS